MENTKSKTTKQKKINRQYIDGFVIPLPKKKIQSYRRMSQKAGKVWREYGALDYIECAGDDLNKKTGLPFLKLTKAKPGETVVFSWIIYKSKAHRNAVNAKIMKDPRIAKMMNPNDMPFEMKRMSFGGFKIIVDE
jgi:uncharacterized protein YbaA (DUF1428 family)